MATALARMLAGQERVWSRLNANQARQDALEQTPPPAEQRSQSYAAIERVLREALEELQALDARLTFPDPRENLDVLIQQRAQARRIAAALDFILRREA